MSGLPDSVNNQFQCHIFFCLLLSTIHFLFCITDGWGVCFHSPAQNSHSCWAGTTLVIKSRFSLCCDVRRPPLRSMLRQLETQWYCKHHTSNSFFLNVLFFCSFVSSREMQICPNTRPLACRYSTNHVWPANRHQSRQATVSCDPVWVLGVRAAASVRVQWQW